MLLSDVTHRLGQSKSDFLASHSEMEIVSVHLKDFNETIVSADLENTVPARPLCAEKDGDCVQLILVNQELLQLLDIDHIVLDL